jgi:hypothetical protein
MSTEIAEVSGANVSVEWSSPHSNVWIGRRGDDDAGVVEFVDGHFVVNDANGCAVKSFASLLAAKQSVEGDEEIEQHAPRNWPRPAAWFAKRGTVRSGVTNTPNGPLF